MDININVNFNVSELMEAINNLLSVLDRRPGLVVNEDHQITLKECMKEKDQDNKPIEMPQNEISLETVRAKLAALSQSGKQAEVKALITDFGVSKLTEISQEKYPELLKKAEDI